MFDKYFCNFQCWILVQEASVWDVKDFTENQELRQKQSYGHFSSKEKGWVLQGIDLE
jgi:hypothetical protein